MPGQESRKHSKSRTDFLINMLTKTTNSCLDN